MSMDASEPVLGVEHIAQKSATHTDPCTSFTRTGLTAAGATGIPDGTGDAKGATA